MNKIRIAAVVCGRLSISLIAIYLLDTFYFPGSLLNYAYALLIGVGVMLLDPRGATVIVHIRPIGSDGYARMTRFRPPDGWHFSVKEDQTGDCRKYVPIICAETFSLFDRILAWDIYETISPPKNARFSVSVETGVFIGQ